MPGGHHSNTLSEGSPVSREGPAYIRRHFVGLLMGPFSHPSLLGRRGEAEPEGSVDAKRTRGPVRGDRLRSGIPFFS